MVQVEEAVAVSKMFLVEVLSKASVNVSWDVDSAAKAFRWAAHCERVFESVKASGRLNELKECMTELGLKLKKPLLFRMRNIENAVVLLLEEFLRNPHLSDEQLFIIIKSMSSTMEPCQFEAICEKVAERKTTYQDATKVIQQTEDDEAIMAVKVMILKEDLLQDLDKSNLREKINPLLRTVPAIEILLSVLSRLSSAGGPHEIILRTEIVNVFESLLDFWIQGESKSDSIVALIAAPINLSRKLCEISDHFLISWLQVFGHLASNLKPVYYSSDHVWSWPNDDEIWTDPRCRGLWFSFDQLFRHFQSLCSVDDTVSDRALSFVSESMLQPDCSVWMEVEQKLSIKGSILSPRL